MDISMTPQLEAMVIAKVQEGRFRDVSEVVGEAVRLLLAVDDQRAAKLAALRQAIAVGDADLKGGRFTTIDSADELDAFFADL